MIDAGTWSSAACPRASHATFQGRLMITVNTEHYPFVLASYRGDSFPEAMLTAMFEQTGKIAKKAIADGTYHVVLTLGGANMNAAQRKIVADLLAKFPESTSTTASRRRWPRASR